MQSIPLPYRGASRHAFAGIALAVVVGLTACSSGDNLDPGPNVPENPGSNPSLREASFIFDVNLKAKTVKVTGPSRTVTAADLAVGKSPINASIVGPDFSILSNDAITLATSNFFASDPGAITPNKIRVYFDVQIQNKLAGINLATPNFPTPPAGQTGVLLFPYSTNVTTTSGGVGSEGGNTVVVELPSRGEVQPSVDWNGDGAPDNPSFPNAPGAGGEPHNFFNDASCTVAPTPGNVSDCFRYENFGTIAAGGLSSSRRVGFDIDASVGEFRARLIVAADLAPASGPVSGSVSGTVTSPERGPLSGVTVTLQGVATPQITDASGNYSFTSVGVGARTVTLSTLPSGCTTITPSNGQSVNVTGGGASTQNYSVTCTAQTGTINGTITRSGAGAVADLRTTTLSIDPDAVGPANVLATANGGAAAAATYTATVAIGTGLGAGSGTVTITAVPSDCTIPAAGTYSGLTSGGTQTVNFTVTCTAPPPPAARYVYKSTWGTPSGGTVDLAISFDPSGFNDPAPELNGAGADAIGGAQALTQLSGTNVARLTAVSAVATANFGSATLGGSLPITSWLANTTVAGGFTTLQEIARLRYTIGGSGAASIGTTTTLSEVSTPNGDPFNLIFSGAGQNIDVIEAGTAGSPALVLP